MKKEKVISVEEAPKKAEKEKEKLPEVQKEVPSSKAAKQPKITKVGAMLKEMRLQKDLKLTDISKQLCIRKYYLESIEDSAYDNIPPVPYGIGFIRSYAKFLGLNSENIVDLYKEETHISEPVDIRVLEPQAEANMPNIRYIIISIAAIALLYIGWLVFNRSSSLVEEEQSIEYNDASNNGGVIVVEEFSADQVAQKDESSPNKASLPAEAKPQVTVTDEVYQEPEVKEAKDAPKATPADETPKENTPSEPVAKAPIVVPNTGVFVEIVKESWIEVKDDTKLYISKVLQPGDTYTVPQGEGMIFSVGKPEGVKVYINGVETPVVRPNKKTNIALDEFLNANH